MLVSLLPGDTFACIVNKVFKLLILPFTTCSLYSHLASPFSIYLIDLNLERVSACIRAGAQIESKHCVHALCCCVMDTHRLGPHCTIHTSSITVCPGEGLWGLAMRKRWVHPWAGHRPHTRHTLKCRYTLWKTGIQLNGYAYCVQESSE